jgi:tRNA(Ile)-lysidine synthase
MAHRTAEDSLVYSLRAFNGHHALIASGDRLLLAVSGGIDSMVLLDVLLHLRQAWNLTLAIAHVNHQLRGSDSDEDEAFVRGIAKERGLECHVERANTESRSYSTKQSIQEVARTIRYEFFKRLREAHGYRTTATAHNADDNAETVLFNVLRGTGVRGMTGIPIRRDDESIIRPLRFATRTQIQSYAEKHKLIWREDASNLKTDYRRNLLRNAIIPQIRQAINPGVNSTLNRTSVLFSGLEHYIEVEAHRVSSKLIVQRSSEQIVIDREALHQAPRFLQEVVLQDLAKELGGNSIEYGTVQSMIAATHAETGTSCSVGSDVVLYRDRERIVVRRERAHAPYCYHVAINQTYDFATFVFSSEIVSEPKFASDPEIEFVDALSMGTELTLRTWEDGDSFVPFGMAERKKVSDFFIDEKIPLFEKRTIPILVSDGEIVWICGKRLDDRFRVTPQTQKILKLEFHPYGAPDFTNITISR